MKSIILAITFLTGMTLAYWSFEAVADTEYDETVNGYIGYDYESGEVIELNEDPTGGWDGYNYSTHEYFDVEESPSGGFTIYSND